MNSRRLTRPPIYTGAEYQILRASLKAIAVRQGFEAPAVGWGSRRAIPAGSQQLQKPFNYRTQTLQRGGLLCRAKSGLTLCSLPDEPRLHIEPFNDVDNGRIRGWQLDGLVVVLKHIVPHVALETPLT